MTPTSFILIIFPATVLLGSLALLVWAWRGKRLDDHPICRRCGFDLFGLPEGATLCSECGADLNRKRAIREGNRQRHVWAIGASVILLLAAGAATGGLGLVHSKRIDLAPYKPNWLLRMDARSSGGDAQQAALRELLNRLQSGVLDGRRIRQLVADALKAQAQAAGPWRSEWGLFIERARRAGHVSDEQWERYYEQAVRSAYELKVLPGRSTDAIELALIENPARIGSMAVMKCRYSLRIDGRVFPVQPRSRRLDDMVLLAPDERPRGIWQREVFIVDPARLLHGDRQLVELTMVAEQDHRFSFSRRIRDIPSLVVSLRCEIDPPCVSSAPLRRDKRILWKSIATLRHPQIEQEQTEATEIELLISPFPPFPPVKMR